jgi:hypothetical protein
MLYDFIVVDPLPRNMGLSMVDDVANEAGAVAYSGAKERLVVVVVVVVVVNGCCAVSGPRLLYVP